MNINTHEYVDTGFEQTLAEDIREHHDIIGKTWALTGEVALLAPADPDMRGTGVLQVWSKTAEGVWVHVTPDGDVLEAACPFGD